MVGYGLEACYFYYSTIMIRITYHHKLAINSSQYSNVYHALQITNAH